ncbi:MAG: FKBP-type peptidyl-prolyl cis-trans isomerase [bacterium]
MKYWLVLSIVGLMACGGSQAPQEEPVTETQTQAIEAAPEVVFTMTNDAPADVAEVPADAIRTPSGLAYKILNPPTDDGRGASALATVTAHYVGWTTDGQRFDSSLERGEPATFPLDKVIKGWQEGVGTMREGEIRRLWIPEDLAYQGKEGYPAGMLVFDVQLITVQ